MKVEQQQLILCLTITEIEQIDRFNVKSNSFHNVTVKHRIILLASCAIKIVDINGKLKVLHLPGAGKSSSHKDFINVVIK